MKKSTRRPTPKALSLAAQTWRRKLIAEFGIADPAGLLLLEGLARAFDRATEAAAIIDLEGASSLDRFGQRRAHPMLLTEHSARSLMLKHLAALRLDLEPVGPPGRPPGRPPGPGRTLER